MKLIKKLFAMLAASALLVSGFAGCSDVNSETSSAQDGYGTLTVNFASRAVEYGYSNIKLIYRAENSSATNVAANWATTGDIKPVQIPVGTYIFKLSADVKITEGSMEETARMTGEQTATVKNGENTVVSFTLKRSSSAEPETVTKGELNEDGSYTIIKWIAADYAFTDSTTSTDINGKYDDVKVTGAKAKSGNTYIQLSKNNAGQLSFNVPANTSKIVVNAKAGSSGATACKMTVSAAKFAKEVSATAGYADYVFEPAFESENSSDAISVTVSNADSASSLNVASVIVYAPTEWVTTNAPVINTSENAGIYEPEDQVVDVEDVVNTEAVTEGSSIEVVKAEGWLNSAYVIFKDTAESYEVTCDGKAVDSELIRHYSTYKFNEPSYSNGQTIWEENSYSNVVRVDVLGLAAGEHTISVTPAGKAATTIKTNVLNHDRSGYAFSGTETPGAYNKDGTLKSNAVVIYVTKDTAKTVSYNGVTGLQAILDESSVKNITVPLDIRIIGKVSLADLDYIASKAEGLQIKNNKTPVTIEGVGHDATIWGYGIFLRSSTHVEIANLGVMCFIDDGLSFDTANYYTWVHNVDLFYGSTGGDSDQAKGDGSLDVKGKSNWQTYSYLHFWDSGKMSLCGMKSEDASSRLTYHHNWFDHSDSRHPRIRTQTVHIYNNYYDGNSKYGVGVTMGASAFVEGNIFRNPHDPMMSSKQGTDATGDGTFSGENGGVIKAFNNMFFQLGYNGVKFQFITNKDTGWTEGNNDIDCYIVDSRDEKVPDTVKAVSGGTGYNNFDTTEDLYLEDGSLTEPSEALNKVFKFSGRHNPDFAWTFDNAVEDANYSLIKELKAAVVGYNNTGLTKIGN